MKVKNLDLAIEIIKGAAAAIDLASGGVGKLEDIELFKALTPHSIAQIAADVDSYVATLQQVKELMDKNDGKLPADDDPTIKPQLRAAGMIGQGDGNGDEEFKTALNDLFGYNFM